MVQDEQLEISKDQLWNHGAPFPASMLSFTSLRIFQVSHRKILIISVLWSCKALKYLSGHLFLVSRQLIKLHYYYWYGIFLLRHPLIFAWIWFSSYFFTCSSYSWCRSFRKYQVSTFRWYLGCTLHTLNCRNLAFLVALLLSL